MENILEIKGLKKEYKDFSLHDISFSLPMDCITGFIGVNGAGKTTTLKAILNLIPKESGSVQIFGMDMDTNEKAIKERIGIVLDDGGFYDELNLSEMKSIIASAYKSWDELEYKKYLDRFSLNPKQKISTLSKGMRMKYALALALSHKAELLIMDEPTSGLDPLIRSQLLDILKEFMAKGGHGVFFSTHITSDLDKIADMLIMIDGGRIVFQEEKDILLDNYRIVPHNQGHSALGKGVSYGKSHYRLGQPRERKKYVFLHSGKSPDPRQAESDHHQCGNQCSYASGVAAGADHSDQCLCRAGTEQRGNRYLFGGRACYRAQKLSLHWSDGLCCR